jgi:hypothetical protein
VNILESLKKRVSFEHVEGDGSLLDMGVSPEDIAAMKRKERPFTPAPEFQRRFSEFKTQFIDGDELWYYESIHDALSGTGGYAIIRGGRRGDRVVASITTWNS